MKTSMILIFGFLAGFFCSRLTTDWILFEDSAQAFAVAITSALTSFFLDFAFREGNIFAFWIHFLNRYFYENRKNPFRFLYSPLGGCAFCMNIWIAIGMYIPVNIIFGASWWFILPSVVLSHLLLNVLMKHFSL